MSEVHNAACTTLAEQFKTEEDKNKNSTDNKWKTEWCDKVGETHQDCSVYTDNCPGKDVNVDAEVIESFTMMNDNKSMNSILVFGLFIILSILYVALSLLFKTSLEVIYNKTLKKRM